MMSRVRHESVTSSVQSKAQTKFLALVSAMILVGALLTSTQTTYAHSSLHNSATPNYVPCSSLGTSFIVNSTSAGISGGGEAYAELWETPDAVTGAPCRWYAHAIESGGASGTLAAYLMDTGNLGNCNNLATAASTSSSGTADIYTNHVTASTPVEAQTLLNSVVVAHTPCLS